MLCQLIMGNGFLGLKLKADATVFFNQQVWHLLSKPIQ